MTENRTTTTDIEHTRALTLLHRPTAERVLTGHPHAQDINRSLEGWLVASALLEAAGTPGDSMNALKCLVVSIYAMGYGRGRREANLPVFIVRDQEREGL